MIDHRYLNFFAVIATFVRAVFVSCPACRRTRGSFRFRGYEIMSRGGEFDFLAVIAIFAISVFIPARLVASGGFRFRRKKFVFLFRKFGFCRIVATFAFTMLVFVPTRFFASGLLCRDFFDVVTQSGCDYLFRSVIAAVVFAIFVTIVAVFKACGSFFVNFND